MILFISAMMLAAVALEIFCLLQLSATQRPEKRPVQREPKVKEEAKKTRLGRPIQIVQIKA